MKLDDDVSESLNVHVESMSMSIKDTLESLMVMK